MDGVDRAPEISDVHFVSSFLVGNVGVFAMNMLSFYYVIGASIIKQEPAKTSRKAAICCCSFSVAAMWK
ncbi:hypothetical protein [Herbaspirillum autotrophicum]|uniref:hypothetical protein n=1 Tax=Herbaspirillum autotrophicum TaxID=180195 RepID=UPI000AF9B770|nr:hypothetical protein [Herbaspirillum autotrophicum]